MSHCFMMGNTNKQAEEAIFEADAQNERRGARGFFE